MPNVFIIGGGLSGLAAALECQRLNIPCRLLEVKARLGGSLFTETVDGWRLDHGSFAFPQAADWSFLESLGLAEVIYPLYPTQSTSRRVAFQGGAGAVIEALQKALTIPVIHRMALSSIGELDGRYTLCLENGLMWEAAGVIVAAPARFAERMFRTLAPPVSERLFDYPYDPLTRVALGFRKADLPSPSRPNWDMGYPHYDYTDHPDRAPADHWLLQLAVRYPLDQTTPEQLLTVLRRDFNWQAAPVIQRVGYWPEAAPIPPHDPAFQAQMAALMAHLPPRIALAGSDYAGLDLAARIESGRAAARKLAREL
jgi:protoporphyrinogen oxidase